MNPSQYDAIVSDLYRAATGAIDWEQALEGVRLAFQARCAPFQTRDLQSGTLIAANSGGPDMSRPVLDYLREYHRCDPRAVLAMSQPPGTWLHCSDHHDDAFVAQDRFYQEYLPSFGSRFVSGVVLPIDSTTVSVFGIQLPAERGPLNPDEREWARRIGEHLREALVAHERVRKMAAQALAGHTLLSSFPYPMWLMDAERFVFYANPAAEGEIQNPEPAVKPGSRFELTSRSKNQALIECLLRLQWASHGSTSVLSLSRKANSTPLWLHMSLLVPGKVLGAFGDKPQILVTLFDPEQISRLDPFALASMFGLTPSEAKVATQIAEGVSPADIADQNGVKLTTVRTQISQVLAKLGASRQADVVRMLRQGDVLWSKPSGQA